MLTKVNRTYVNVSRSKIFIICFSNLWITPYCMATYPGVIECIEIKQCKINEIPWTEFIEICLESFL